MKQFALPVFVLFFMFFAVAAQAQYSETRYADTSPGVSANLGFGGAVAISEGEIFVGSASIHWPRGDEPAALVHYFTKLASGQWLETGILKASDAKLGDTFGRSVYVNGSKLVIGAPGNGAAYLFEKDSGGGWVETGKMMPSKMAEGAEFAGAFERGGYRTDAIAMAGERVAVASYNKKTMEGAVHVFHKMDGEWKEETILMPENLEAGSGFGSSLVAEGDYIAVGADQAGAGKGMVYVFKRDAASGTWMQEASLVGRELTERSNFAASLAMHRGMLYAGAPRFDRSGAVFVFGRDQNGEWNQVNQLHSFAAAADGRPTSGFGASLAISDDALLVSAARGTVYAFQADSDGNWESLRQIKPIDQRSSEGFGVGLGVYGDVAVVGSPMADHEEGLASVYHRDASGKWAFAATLASEVAHIPSITGNQVDCEDGEADGFSCDKVDLISFMSASDLASDRGVKMTDIWGWEDPVTGKEWVLQARTEGVSFVDISNPYNPVYVGEVLKTATSPGSAWRDVKVYKDHAFIVADGAAAHGIQIFDLTQLRDVKPEDMPVTFEQTAFYDGVHSTHNIVINEETGFAYAVGNRAGGETCGGQLHMINVQDPKNPTFAGCFSHPNAGGTHDSQCVTYRGPDTRYAGREICLNSNGSSFIIADVTDKDNPKTLTHTTYPNLAYTHQGWLTEDQKYFYMNDELDELNGNVENTRTLIWDVQDLEDPVLVKEFLLDSKASDHNLYVRGNFMYQSNYQAGLRILDITDPVNPVEAAFFDTVPYGGDEPGFGGSWSNYPYFKSGIIAVSSRGEGMFLLKKRDVDI